MITVGSRSQPPEDFADVAAAGCLTITLAVVIFLTGAYCAARHWGLL